MFERSASWWFGAWVSAPVTLALVLWYALVVVHFGGYFTRSAFGNFHQRAVFRPFLHIVVAYALVFRAAWF